MDAFHQRLARTGLAAAERYGFALAGGYAVQAAGLLVRPTEDIDLFTAWEQRDGFAAAVSAVIEAYLAEGLAVGTERRHDAFVRLTVSDGERTSKVELAVDTRANEPIRMTIGPVLHPDDAIANKMNALYERALARDFIDIDAALESGRYNTQTLLGLIERADVTFDRQMFAEALGQIHHLDPDDFAEYGVDGQHVDRLRDRFEAWRLELLPGVDAPLTRRAATSVAERYLRLGLRLGRHDSGIVDAYFGPPALAAEIEAEPPMPPDTLVVQAEELLSELDDGWMRDQVVGLRTCAGVLAGESLSYADEVQGCYGVRPTHTDEATFAAAHDQLEQLLPGSGPLAARYQRWREEMLVPAELVEPTITAVIAQARSLTRDLVDLPDGEGIVLELVRDEPWMAYNFYLGDLRGRVAVNTGLSMSAIELLHIAIHETYPGHQAERAAKEELLVRGQGMTEETLVLLPTPQSVISEGIAQLAPRLLLHGDGGAELAAIIHRAGITLDLAHALAIERARTQCQRATVNAALMLHEGGASTAEAQAYLERWGLINSERAAHAIRFVTEPDSRTYVTVYPAGLALCSAYVAGEPGRFRQLLTQQVRVGDLYDASATVPGQENS